MVREIIACVESLTHCLHIQNITVQISGLTSKLQTVNNLSSSVKSISGISHDLSEVELIQGCRLGIDTHADSSCAGRHVRPLEFISGKKFSVTPFHDSYAPKSDVGMIN